MPKHRWKKMEVADRRPHYRCSACRFLAVLVETETETEQRAALDSREPCYGEFQMAPQHSLTYAAWVAAWFVAGSPKRSPEEVARLWAACCGPCPERTAKSVCRRCECRVLPCGPPECNMLAWATAKCPIGKFQATTRATATADHC